MLKSPARVKCVKDIIQMKSGTISCSATFILKYTKHQENDREYFPQMCEKVDFTE